jgi:hypothetical protein
MVVRLKLIPENVSVNLCQISAVVGTFIVATNPSNKCWDNPELFSCVFPFHLSSKAIL